MHNIRKAVYKFFLVIFFIGALSVAARLCYESWESRTLQSKNEREGLKGTIDTIYCGNSLTYYSFNPKVMDEALGTNSFNLATASQPYIGTYYLIRDAVEENPIQRVYVTVTMSPLKEEAGTRHYVSGFENMRTWKWKLRYLAAIHKEDVWLSALLYTPQVENYFDVKEIPLNLKNKLVTQEKSPKYTKRGYLYTKAKFTGREEEKNTKSNTWFAEEGEGQIQEEALYYLEKIVSFCREQGIQLTFVTMPYPQAYIDGAGDLDAFNEYMEGKAREWGVEYLNFVLYKDRENVFTDDKFRDDRHMNADGSKAFTSIFSEVVQSERPQEFFYDNMAGFEDKM